MKKYFFAGLAIILPIILTFLVLNFLIKFLTAPFLALTQLVLTQVAHTFGSTYFDHSPQTTLFISQLLILLFLFSIIMLVGLLGRHFLAHTFFKVGDRIIHSIPFANKIYKAVQDVVKNLFSEEKPSFSKAVIIPFPHAKSEAIGFITKENMAISIPSAHDEYISVFVPGTPNPMMGFMLLVPKKFLKPLNLTLDEALKFVVSCGVIYKKNST